MASIPFPYIKRCNWLYKICKNEDVNKHIHFAIVLKDNKVIGGTEIRNIDKNGTAGGGIWINENYQKWIWNRGILHKK